MRKKHCCRQVSFQIDVDIATALKIRAAIEEITLRELVEKMGLYYLHNVPQPEINIPKESQSKREE